MIEKIIQYFLPCLINVMAGIYILSKIMDKKIKLKSIFTYLIIFILNITAIINYLYVDDLIRFFTSIVAVTLGSYILFRDDFHKTFMSVIFEQVIMFVSELLLMLIFILIFRANTEQVFANQGTLLANLEISVISIGLISFKPLLRLLQKIVSFISDLDGMHKYFLIIILMLTLNILLVALYSSTENTSMLLINFFFIFIYSYIVYASLSEKNTNMIFRTENKVLINNLGEYEKMLSYQSEVNHENKNQLLVIKGMYQQKEDIVEYIDNIIEDQRTQNDTFYNKTKRIPSGGMQGLIYQKMVTMENKKIRPILNIDESIDALDFTKMNSKLNYDICRILGVFLDNAIEETETLIDNKREIIITIRSQNRILIIEISNHFNQPPELERMEERGYTTKSKGHGYGLSLVKEIINKNSKLDGEKRISKDLFSQIVKIKM